MERTKENILTLGRNGLTPEDYDLLYKHAFGLNTIVEIGARCGTSSMLFGSIAKKVYTIECEPVKEWRENINAMGLTNVEMLHGYSPWIILNKDIDFLFIDGDHRTIMCIADYVHFLPFVTVGGKIAIHDTITPIENVAFMVNRAIDIIKEESPNLKEIDRCAGACGTVVFEKTKAYGV